MDGRIKISRQTARETDNRGCGSSQNRTSPPRSRACSVDPEVSVLSQSSLGLAVLAEPDAATSGEQQHLAHGDSIYNKGLKLPSVSVTYFVHSTHIQEISSVAPEVRNDVPWLLRHTRLVTATTVDASKSHLQLPRSMVACV